MPTNFLGTARQKIFDGKTWYPLVCIKFFDIQIFWNIEGMPTNFFGTVRPKIFDGNLWYPLLCIKFFDTPNFLKHWRYAHEIFRHCETKTTTGDLDTPPPLIQTFSIPEIIATLKDSPTEIFGTERKIFGRKILIHPPPLFYPNFFGTRNKWNTKRFPCEIFRHCETKKFR